MGRFPHDPVDIFYALNDARVRYLVVGGVAAIFHGVPRTTFDTDLAVELEAENLRTFERVMSRLGFAARVPASVTGLADPRTRRQWTQRKAMKVFSFVERRKPFRVVDVMVHPLRQFGRLYAGRVIARHEKVRVPLIPLSALIAMKKTAGRIEDVRDVEYLEIIRRKIRSRTSTL